MIQFNLEKYLRLKEEGKEPRIITRDGHDARILCTDMKAMGDEVIGALVMGREGFETLRSYHSDGRYGKYADYELDLFFADLEEEPTCRPYKTLEEVLEAVKEHGHYVKDGNTVRILKKFTLMENGEIRYRFSGGVESGRTWEELSKRITWADGSPFGAKEGDIERTLELEDGRIIKV